MLLCCYYAAITVSWDSVMGYNNRQYDIAYFEALQEESVFIL